MSRILLSAPHMGTEERELLLEAFDSNWIAPLGEHVDAFEKEFVSHIGEGHAVAVSSGTAGLHLALVALGVGRGDDVLISDLTFVATANAVAYVGARPCLIDSDPGTWTLDPSLLAAELKERARYGRLPKAVIAVDLYGQCADYDSIVSSCSAYDIPLIEDAAEALGATYRGRSAGTFGHVGVFSFNGNKIITTSAGGMIVSPDKSLVDYARYLATQAREPVLHYEHLEVGHNYRLSNLLAAIGRGQLLHLSDRVERRRAINSFYRRNLEAVDGIEFMPEACYGRSTSWLTCLTIEPDQFGATRDDVIAELAQAGAEARPTWKPMHMQPVFSGCPLIGGQVSEQIFSSGLCLPSGSGLSDDELEIVVDAIIAANRRVRRFTR